MFLSRYEFELLAYLEEKGTAAYAVRDLSDDLCISGAKVKEALEKAVKSGWVKEEKSEASSYPVLSITEEGLGQLAPYQVKKAIILAAGFGSRMVPVTLDRPKPLVKVNGVRILDTLLDAMVGVGITDITIIRGYKKEVFDELLEKYPFLKLVDNDIYDQTNNISSANLVLEEMGQMYLCESDLYITNPSIIKKYQYASNILGSYSLETDDWSFKRDNGYITEYQKGNTYCYNYYGVSFWTEEDAKKLKCDFKDVYENEEGGRDVFWEFIPLVLRKERYQVEIRNCRKQDIMEIDNFFELVELDPSYKEYPGQK